MRTYTVSQVARLSGVSVRTLHHYDEIGLLKPAVTGSNGYRYYGQDELLRLQQILFHRELGFPLAEIGQVLDAPGFDRAEALRRHRGRLEAESRRYRRLVRTIDRTLAALEGASTMDDEDMYKGFSPEKQAEHESWLVDRYGEDMRGRIEASRAKMKGWGKADYQRLQSEAEAVEGALAKAMADGLPADSAAVQALVRRQHDMVAAFWAEPPRRESFCGLAQLYQEHPEFRARYDGRAPGLTDYLAEGMRIFAERELAPAPASSPALGADPVVELAAQVGEALARDAVGLTLLAGDQTLALEALEDPDRAVGQDPAFSRQAFGGEDVPLGVPLQDNAPALGERVQRPLLRL